MARFGVIVNRLFELAAHKVAYLQWRERLPVQTFCPVVEQFLAEEVWVSSSYPWYVCCYGCCVC